MTDRRSRQAPTLSDDEGFTLIETLVALVLMAGAILMVVGVIRNASRIASLIDRSAVVARTSAVQNYLRATIAQAIKPPTTLSAGETPWLVGEPSALSVTTTYAPMSSLKGAWVVSLGLETSAARPGLYDVILFEKLQRPNADKSPPAAARRSILLPAVAGLGVSYYGKATIDDTGPVWADEWRSAALPRLVSIEVKFPPGDVRTWERLTVAVAGASRQ